MKNVMGAYERTFTAMAAFVVKGKIIEDYNAGV
jgi:hypothetical protein